MRGFRTAVAVVAAAAVLTGCGVIDVDLEGLAETGRPGGSGGSSQQELGTNPLDNPDGTKPGLAPITSAKDKAEARAIIEKVATKKRGAKTGYDRDEFGYAWADNADDIPLARNGCDTRNDILRRDLTQTVIKEGTGGCKVLSGVLEDVYTGTTVNFVSGKDTSVLVQIDHVVPLSWAWRHGAESWSEDDLRAFANDPLNLLASVGSVNQSKSDSGPGEWMPPSAAAHCFYAQRYIAVLAKWRLGVEPADRSALETALETCR